MNQEVEQPMANGGTVPQEGIVETQRSADEERCGGGGEGE